MRLIITFFQFFSTKQQESQEINLYSFQIEYQKQRKQVIDSYRGFQTMDSSDHPVVQHGIKAADLISQVNTMKALIFLIYPILLFTYLFSLVFYYFGCVQFLFFYIAPATISFINEIKI